MDPFGQNIYWTDNLEEVIEVASMNGLYRRVLINDNLQDPRDIILDVTRGYIKILIISNYFADYLITVIVLEAYLPGQVITCTRTVQMSACANKQKIQTYGAYKLTELN